MNQRMGSADRMMIDEASDGKTPDSMWSGRMAAGHEESRTAQDRWSSW